MTPEQRIDILERAVADLQRELRDLHGYAPPATADLIDHTPLEYLKIQPFIAQWLNEAGITSIERLAQMDWTQRLPRMTPADMVHLRKQVDGWMKDKEVHK